MAGRCRSGPLKDGPWLRGAVGYRAAPCIIPGARRIAANIAKLPELLRPEPRSTPPMWHARTTGTRCGVQSQSGVHECLILNFGLPATPLFRRLGFSLLWFSVP